MTATAALAERRTELRTERDRLHRARGEATIAGKRFDPSRLVAVESELEGLDDAEQVQHQHDGAEVAAREAERRSAIRAQIAACDAARMSSLRAAEAAAKTLVEALASILNATDEIARHSTTLGTRAPASFDRSAVETRLSNLLVSALQPVRTGAQYFGELEWHAPQPATEDWAEAERRITGRAIEQLTQTEIST